jgi:acyl carrier protein
MMMLSQTRALELIQESMASLRRADLVKDDGLVTENTVLLGAGTTLDSVAFVTLVTDVEERLDRETGRELVLILTDIHDFNPEQAHLSADTLARYMVALAERDGD